MESLVEHPRLSLKKNHDPRMQRRELPFFDKTFKPTSELITTSSI